MNCSQTQNMLDDYIDGDLSTIQLSHTQSHLNSCANCRHIFTESQNLVVALHDIPVPDAKMGYEQRMLSFLQKESKQVSYGQNWFIAGFGSALAATLTLWLSFSTPQLTSLDAEQMNTVNLVVQEQKTIDLVFNLQSDLADATLTIELPDKTEIAGFPSKRQLTWNTSFKKGANRLALPLIASELNNGVLTAHLNQNGKTKTFHVRINVKSAPTSLFIEHPIFKMSVS